MVGLLHCVSWQTFAQFSRFPESRKLAVKREQFAIQESDG